ncbi:YL1 nuclear, C-terminal [Penicillium expansum]|uniref:YL1 nuclear, C-terminal n=1 Tax=Penicillium expansum TaxID=27334 RepID=A0A0A2JBR7_PENEN|nr:YL1 nuclear, C-terminal [Penicillium expansum]KGO43599.1 YL1 nuclear, C-terminal [Penicillium expansum]KGO52809.1 YL1 nuclear, C-terminal [Penicillium expansum]KGO70525.1 YL1 nuclear, C-terminal [Penicillium expansum]
MADIMEEDPSSGLPSSEEEEMPVESLVRGRAKRSTAGLHMSALLEAAADDDLALLFEEVEDDNEFADVADPDAEDDLLESSDEDEDQGPNAQNDYEGEQKLQKDERKKRRAQNDLRFQTLRKRVKIDPTAPSTMSAAPRPKKKSERISWIPTVEDGPTRQSSRRQTMVNKELTHARLKDSQEKRVRIIATMKEAEKRKAHLKPKEMTQEDHLAEAARVERLNSKSLNRWELSEKRKADERRARIEALQNRRLDGPVISYWSGVATWTNGRLTRVGKIDIKPKTDKEESRKKKKEKEDKEKAVAESKALGSATIVEPAPASTTGTSQPPPNLDAAPTNPTNPALPPPTSTLDQKTPENKPPENAAVTTTETTDTPVVSSRPNVNQPDAKSPETKSIATPAEQSKDNAVEMKAPEVDANTPVAPSEQDQPITAERQSSESSKQSERKMFAVEIPASRHVSDSAGNGSTPKLPEPSPTKNDDAMDIDQPPAAAAAAESTKNDQEVPESKDQAILATPQVASAQPTSIETPTSHAAGTAVQEPPPVDDSRPVESATAISPGVALAHKAPVTAAPGQATVPENAPVQSLNQPSTLQSESQLSNGMVREPTEPGIPEPPPVIEHTGRCLTILENFDYATANHRKYSMYFNAKKPARLTKISSSLCVITSLPSRYRDPDTALPYANSYAYGQIRRLLSEGYIWSSMLGCFVGPAEAARGVPERFTGKPGPGTVKLQTDKAEGQTESITGKRVDKVVLGGEVPSTPTPATTRSAPPGEPMEIDKA